MFTCKDCGSHELNVILYCDRKFYCKEELECFDNCSNYGELAAIKEYQRIDSYECWGPLDEDHHFTQEEENIVETLREDENFQIFCNCCYETADPRQWNFYEESDDDDYENEFYVHCGDCDREIEFGWSHPDRGGRIWPVECEDFNPWKCWPEPRYRENWAKKNWIRPDR
jgi:hypothetical protein